MRKLIYLLLHTLTEAHTSVCTIKPHLYHTLTYTYAITHIQSLIPKMGLESSPGQVISWSDLAMHSWLAFPYLMQFLEASKMGLHPLGPVDMTPGQTSAASEFQATAAENKSKKQIGNLSSSELSISAHQTRDQSATLFLPLRCLAYTTRHREGCVDTPCRRAFLRIPKHTTPSHSQQGGSVIQRLPFRVPTSSRCSDRRT